LILWSLIATKARDRLIIAWKIFKDFVHVDQTIATHNCSISLGESDKRGHLTAMQERPRDKKIKIKIEMGID
jgi:hypothetical protein